MPALDSLDTVIQWHTSSAVYTCTAGTLLKIVSGMMESHPEWSTDQPFLRLSKPDIRKTRELEMKKTCQEGMVVLKAPRRKEELFMIEDIAIRRWQKEVGLGQGGSFPVLKVKEEVQIHG